jgi:hypothetical protein
MVTFCEDDISQLILNYPHSFFLKEGLTRLGLPENGMVKLVLVGHEILDFNFFYLSFYIYWAFEVLTSPTHTKHVPNHLFVTKTACVDIGWLIIYTCCFPKLSDQSEPVFTFSSFLLIECVALPSFLCRRV